MLLFTASYGLLFGIRSIRRNHGKEDAPLRVPVNRAFERYFVVMFPFLVMAAAIEIFIILRPR